MNVRSSWRNGHAAIDREARLDRSGRHELQRATDQISADGGNHFSSRPFANRLELQSFSLAPSEIECHEFGAYDVGLGSADRGNRSDGPLGTGRHRGGDYDHVFSTRSACVSARAHAPSGGPTARSDQAADENQLVISGEKKAESTREKKDWHVEERSYGSFYRSMSLPFEPAHFDKGVCIS
jgi:hypothetical protein